MTSRSWVLNGPDEQFGSASIVISNKEPKLTEQLLRFGNIVYIHDGVLPDWCGEVGEPEEGYQGEVVVNALSIETILDDRTCGSNTFEGYSADVILSIIQEAHRQSPMIITDGDLETGGQLTKSITYGKSALMLIQEQQAATGYEWGVEPALGEYKIPTLSIWWDSFRGEDLSGSVSLIEGVNIEFAAGPLYTKHGRIKNEVTVSGTTLVHDEPFLTIARNDDSISTFGLRQRHIIGGIATGRALQARAITEVANNATPYYRFYPTANNPTIYPYLKIGNILGIQLKTVGRTGGRTGITSTVRIVGMATDDEIGTVELTVQEVL